MLKCKILISECKIFLFKFKCSCFALRHRFRVFRLQRFGARIERRRARIRRLGFLKYGIDPFLHLEKRRFLRAGSNFVDPVEDVVQYGSESFGHDAGSVSCPKDKFSHPNPKP